MERRTRALVLLFALLAAVFYLTEIRGRDARETAARKAGAVFPVAAAEISGILLSNGVALERAGERFRLVRPVDAAADDEAVAALIARLIDLRWERRLEVPADSLAHFGLAPPRAWARVSGAQGMPITLELGAPTHADNYLYARVPESDACGVVWGGVRSALERPADQLRDASLLRARRADVESFEITRPAGMLSIERDEARGWRIAAPFRARASAEAVGALIDALAGTRARAYLDGPADATDSIALVDAPATGAGGARAQEGPARRIALVVRGAQGVPDTQRIALAPLARPDGLVRAAATLQERPVLVDLGVARLFDTPAESLRDARLFRDAPDRAASFTIGRGGETLLVESTGDAWMITRPESIAADPVRVRAFLRNLENERLRGWVDGVSAEQAGLANPRAVVELRFDAPPRTERLAIGSQSDSGDLFASRLDEPEVALLPARVLEFVVPQARLFESRRVLEDLLAPAREISVALGGTALRFERRGDGWRETHRALPDEAARAIVQRLSALAPLDRFRAGAAQAGFGFDAPAFRIEWDGPRTGSLEIGAALDPDRTFARLAGRDAVYLLHTADIESLQSALGATRGQAR